MACSNEGQHGVGDSVQDQFLSLHDQIQTLFTDPRSDRSGGEISANGSQAATMIMTSAGPESSVILNSIHASGRE